MNLRLDGVLAPGRFYEPLGVEFDSNSTRIRLDLRLEIEVDHRSGLHYRLREPRAGPPSLLWTLRVESSWCEVCGLERWELQVQDGRRVPRGAGDRWEHGLQTAGLCGRRHHSGLGAPRRHRPLPLLPRLCRGMAIHMENVKELRLFGFALDIYLLHKISRLVVYMLSCPVSTHPPHGMVQGGA